MQPNMHLKSIGGGRFSSNVTWTPTFRNQQLTRKGLSQRVQNHNQHDVVRIEPVFLMLVGGHEDNVADLCGEVNVDTYINIFCDKSIYFTRHLTLSLSLLYIHRHTGMKSAYVTDRFAIQFKTVCYVRHLIMV
jgi:hypothetical protein